MKPTFTFFSSTFFFILLVVSAFGQKTSVTQSTADPQNKVTTQTSADGSTTVQRSGVLHSSYQLIQNSQTAKTQQLTHKSRLNSKSTEDENSLSNSKMPAGTINLTSFYSENEIRQLEEKMEMNGSHPEAISRLEEILEMRKLLKALSE